MLVPKRSGARAQAQRCSYEYVREWKAEFKTSAGSKYESRRREMVLLSNRQYLETEALRHPAGPPRCYTQIDVQARRAGTPFAGAVRHRIEFSFMRIPGAIGGFAADRSGGSKKWLQSSGGFHHRHRLCRPFGPENRWNAKGCEKGECEKGTGHDTKKGHEKGTGHGLPRIRLTHQTTKPSRHQAISRLGPVDPPSSSVLTSFVSWRLREDPSEPNSCPARKDAKTGGKTITVDPFSPNP